MNLSTTTEIDFRLLAEIAATEDRDAIRADAARLAALDGITMDGLNVRLVTLAPVKIANTTTCLCYYNLTGCPVCPA